MKGETALQTYKDLLREGFNTYTREAFYALPQLERPRILDVGCGSGVPTMELARLCRGEIVALDIDQSLLDRLASKAEEAGVSERVSTTRCSMLDMDFPEESFDIIWAEGSIQHIGFQRGLTEWRRFLKPHGFLVVHDETGAVSEKLEHIASCGYELRRHFTVSSDAWWAEFYAPLEKRISEMRAAGIDDPRALEEADSDQRFIDTFKEDPSRYGSVFFIMEKRG